MESNDTNDNNFPVQEWIQREMKYYIATIIFCLGIPGNLLTILVCVRMLKGTQTGQNKGFLIYFIALSVSNALGLVLFNVLALEDIPVRKDIRPFWLDLRGVGCQLYSFLHEPVMYSNRWMLALITIERAVIIGSSQISKSPTQPKTVGIVIKILCCFLLFLLTQAWVLVTSGERLIVDVFFDSEFAAEGSNETMCWVLTKNYSYLQNYHGIYDILRYSVIPSVAILASNAVIVIQLARNSRKRQTSVRRKMERDRKDTRITASLLVVSVLYLLTTLPYPIFQIAVPALFATSGDAQHKSTVAAIGVMAWYLSSINYCTDSLAYMAVWESYRKEAVRLVCCKNNETERTKTFEIDE